MTHEFDGKKYAQASGHQREWGAQLIPRGTVVGIDASHGMIETARQRERGNLSFIPFDINELDFVERFDVAFSNATLHWITDHRRLLQSVRRALRPGGRLRFKFAGDGNCSNVFDVIRGAMAHEAFRPSFAAFEWPWYMPTVEAYAGLAESSGLRDVRVWGENADRLFPDAGAMIRWIDQPSLVPFTPCVPERARDAFRGFVIGKMIERTRQDDGRCFETFRRINVSAVK
jgi:trans-aconitate methyltransferase